MKSILVLDTPKNCGECHMYYNTGFYCEPEHCPLTTLPSKKELQHYIQRGDGKSTTHLMQLIHDQGWNNCIDEIIGEK